MLGRKTISHLVFKESVEKSKGLSHHHQKIHLEHFAECTYHLTLPLLSPFPAAIVRQTRVITGEKRSCYSPPL